MANDDFDNQDYLRMTSPFMGQDMSEAERSQIYKILRDLSPQELEALISASTADDERGVLAGREAMAVSEMNLPTPQGLRVGGTYVAANPLEHVATALRRGRGRKDYAALGAGQDAITGRKQAMARSFLEMLKKIGVTPPPEALPPPIASAPQEMSGQEPDWYKAPQPQMPFPWRR